MITKVSIILVCGLLTQVAHAQPLAGGGVDGTFHFTSPQTPQSLTEVATILRTVADLPQVSTDNGQATLVFRGAADRVALAEWMLGELDRPGGESLMHEYRTPAGEVARVNFLSNIPGPQGTQETLTVLRTVADLQKIYNYTPRRAIVMRGKESDIAFAEWLLNELNQPVEQALDSGPHPYGGTMERGEVARVNYLTNVSTPRGMQEMLTVLRTVGDIQKIFNYTPRRALAFRGTPASVDRAEWLIQELNQLPDQPSPGTYAWTTPGADDVTRVFFLPYATPQGLQSALTTVRTEGKIRKAYTTSAPAALVVRGTADQIEAASQLLR